MAIKKKKGWKKKLRKRFEILERELSDLQDTYNIGVPQGTCFAGIRQEEARLEPFYYAWEIELDR